MNATTEWSVERMWGGRLYGRRRGVEEIRVEGTVWEEKEWTKKGERWVTGSSGGLWALGWPRQPTGMVIIGGAPGRR